MPGTDPHHLRPPRLSTPRDGIRRPRLRRQRRPPRQLATAIRRVAAGELVVDPALAAETLASGESPLTARERDVLVAAKPGATVAEIARRLFLSDGTVRNDLSASIAKTGARNRVEAVRIAEEQGWL